MRSLVGITLLLVVGVVVLLGAGVLAWVTADDLARAREDADGAQRVAEAELRALASDLVADAQDSARRLVDGADRRLRGWIADEPLALFRDPVPPHPLDVEALRRGLSAEVRARSLAEGEHVAAVTERMAAEAAARIDQVAAAGREAARHRAEAATADRRRALVSRLGLLLVGMAVLLALLLTLLVVAPVRRLRDAVERISSGDLATPVPDDRWPTQELRALAQDVERMRLQIAAATEGLEGEVRRKTAALEKTLAERTETLEALRATQDRLVQAEKMAGLGTLAGGVAHEFNNLLGGVLGCLESAAGATDDADVLEDLAMAKRTAGRATALVASLLGVARPGERDLVPVALRGIVEDVLQAAEPEARQRRVDLVRERLDDVRVLGDEGQLHQVVLNLVTNAMQAVDDRERVVVALREEDRHVVLEVRDAGPGLGPEDRHRVFEPFFSARSGGTGLGLFVSYGIVERHGGRIEVADAPEGGALFRVLLPRLRT